MIQKLIAALSLFGLTLAPSLVAAKPNEQPKFQLPAQAVEVAPNVYDLGFAYNAERDNFVQGYAYVHKNANAKSSAIRGPKGTKCYGVMAAGAKWKTVEPWVINPANSEGLGADFIYNTVANGLHKWETAANAEIFGNGSLTSAQLVADESTPDGTNEVYFGSIADSNTIGVTIVWGYFAGPTFSRELIEWDQIYNTYYDWTEDAALETTQMDFDNIATHELGHSAGLADIYTSSCSSVTMYGYGTQGEIQKRTLEPADVTGINTLY